MNTNLNPIGQLPVKVRMDEMLERLRSINRRVGREIDPEICYEIAKFLCDVIPARYPLLSFATMDGCVDLALVNGDHSSGKLVSAPEILKFLLKYLSPEAIQPKTVAPSGFKKIVEEMTDEYVTEESYRIYRKKGRDGLYVWPGSYATLVRHGFPAFDEKQLADFSGSYKAIVQEASWIPEETKETRWQKYLSCRAFDVLMERGTLDIFDESTPKTKRIWINEMGQKIADA